MSGLTGALMSSTEALRVFERALTVVQNNVANVSTPGYAKQRLSLESLPFSAETGLTGGVAAGRLESARDQFAEQAVRQQTSLFGASDQRSSSLIRLEPLFDVSGNSGVPGAVNKLLQSFSSWSVAPNDPVARQLVIDSAGNAASRVAETATGLAGASQSAGTEMRSIADQINALASRIREINVQRQQNAASRTDPALDASLNSTLEELSQLVRFTALPQDDGSITVLMEGQTALVVGERQYPIHVDPSGPTAVVYDSEGADITAQIQSGSLGSVIEMRNSTIPSYLADLNRLAQGLTSSVNTILANGVDMDGNPGHPLFAYDTPANAAATLAITDITARELAGARSGAPGGNGNALDLAALATQSDPALDDKSIMGFYATLAQRVGRDVDSAKERNTTQQQLLLQTKAMRSELSDVSLDEEAARLLEFQRAYQATARLVSTLDKLTEETINLLR